MRFDRSAMQRATLLSKVKALENFSGIDYFEGTVAMVYILTYAICPF
jgi:hypothetical protein